MREYFTYWLATNSGFSARINPPDLHKPYLQVILGHIIKMALPRHRDRT